MSDGEPPLPSGAGSPTSARGVGEVVGEGGDAILELRERLDVRRREQVRPDRERLPDLDEGRAAVGQEPCELLRTLRLVGVDALEAPVEEEREAKAQAQPHQVERAEQLRARPLREIGLGRACVVAAVRVGRRERRLRQKEERKGGKADGSADTRERGRKRAHQPLHVGRHRHAQDRTRAHRVPTRPRGQPARDLRRVGQQTERAAEHGARCAARGTEPSRPRPAQRPRNRARAPREAERDDEQSSSRADHHLLFDQEDSPFCSASPTT
jgi:hypothetical protein